MKRRCARCHTPEGELPSHRGLMRVGAWWKLFRPLLCGFCRELLQLNGLRLRRVA